MRTLLIAILVTTAVCLTPGCSKKVAQSPAPVAATGGMSKAGAYLAYEHEIAIKLTSDDIAAHVTAIREACLAETFGACSLLSVEESSGDTPQSRIMVRIVPQGVEPLAKLAAQGGTTWSREIHAEDLADAVGDAQRRLNMLARQREKFEQLEARANVSVSDLLVLSKELARVEVETEAANNESAQQRRRIETNRVTFRFSLERSDSGVTKIKEALTGLWDSLLEGVADSLEYLGYGIPFLVLAFPLAIAWRWLWRKYTR